MPGWLALPIVFGGIAWAVHRLLQLIDEMLREWRGGEE